MTIESAPSDAPAPRDHERIVALDVLRGVAVLGILLINIVGLGAILQAESYPGHDGGPALGWDGLNRSLWWVSQLVVEGTMRGLFTLLFGAGFLLFCAREATSAGRTDIGRLYLRRTALLVVLGVFHALVLFWPGDILLIYGFAGFALYPFRRTGARRLVALACAVLVLVTAMSVGGALERRAEALASTEAVALLPGTTIPDRIDHDAWAAEIATRRAGLPENAGYFARVFIEWLFDVDTLWWTLDALALMFLGAALLRWRVITGGRATGFYARMALVGYAVGLTLGALEAAAMIESGFSPTLVWPAATYQLSRLATTLGHLGLIVWLFKRGACTGAFTALARTGRMALTNYLGQSAIAALLFSGFGLGLYGALDRAQSWAIVLAIWAFELVFSAWWLARFRMGPAEWVWRALTYGRRPEWRRNRHEGSGRA